MQSRQQRPEPNRSAPIDSGALDEWPDAELGIDDDAFARAIAEGRGEKIAA